MRHSVDRLHSWKETEQEFSSKLNETKTVTEELSTP